MFTMAEIDELHDRWGNTETLADYLRGLAAIGVVRFESFLVDGHSEFFGPDGRRVVSPPHHEVLPLAEVSDRRALVEHLRRHSEERTSYVEMSASLAASGVEKWVADTAELTMTYYDQAGIALLGDKVE
jgi:uncharacterized protein YbcV (DUF1398 family)